MEMLDSLDAISVEWRMRVGDVKNLEGHKCVTTTPWI